MMNKLKRIVLIILFVTLVSQLSAQEQPAAVTPKSRTNWYAGIQGGMPFGVSALSSFGADKTRAGWSAGMTGRDWHDLKSRVFMQRYGVQLNVNLLGFFAATRQSRWTLELAPHLHAVGTKADFRTLGGNATARKGRHLHHSGGCQQHGGRYTRQYQGFRHPAEYLHALQCVWGHNRYPSSEFIRAHRFEPHHRYNGRSTRILFLRLGSQWRTTGDDKNGILTKQFSAPLVPNRHVILKGSAGIDGLEIDDNGTWIVSTATALRAWGEAARENLSLNCTLAADITLTGTNNWMPVGNADSQYNGTFDGAGHTISGLNIDSSNGLRNVVLIGFLEPSGTVKNLIIMNASIQIFNDTYNVVGGIVGCNWGTIQGCGFSGTISANAGNEDLASCNAGGISGFAANESVLTTCYYTNADKGVSYVGESTVNDTYKVGENEVTWGTAATAMNNALANEEYQWVATGDANVPLKLKKKSN